MVCNDVFDCPNGEDEINCNTLTCVGILRCKNDELCVHPNQVCDGVAHCPKSEDDERICGSWWCPTSCICIGNVVHCSKYLPNINDFNTNTKGLIFRSLLVSSSYVLFKISKVVHVDLTTSQFKDATIQSDLLNSLQNLQVLLLRYCKLKLIMKHAFQDLKKIQLLDVHGNSFHHLDVDIWNTFVILPDLHFDGNSIRVIEPFSFVGLLEVRMLNFSNNQIAKLHEHTFHGLPKLIFLDITHNPIIHIDISTFRELDASIIVSYSVICCYINSQHNCINRMSLHPFNHNKECKTILPSQFAHKGNGYVGTILLLFIIGAIIYNYKLSKQEAQMLLMTHLYLTDALFVIYVIGMSIISSLNSNNYFYITTLWDQAYLCRTMNALLLCGGLSSKFTICLVAINQLYGTKYALTMRKISKYHLLSLLISIWVIICLYAWFLILRNQSLYTITCTTKIKDSNSTNVMLAHWVYVVVIALLTITTAGAFQQMASHVKQSGARVRSTRDSSVVYKKLMIHTMLGTLVEIVTLMEMCYLLMFSCYAVHKPAITLVLYIACIHAALHPCVYAGRIFVSRWINTISIQLSHK